ncbi:kinase [Streptomyces sp. 150FB]|uniref:aminoglycoside phosphotransferase family protein n=1 Tax=Streptomyces sp. 150FB TaxID=1576605 RepID=UPI00058967AE|nr:aminoglycoside phosphotransferase family protein [Streptomyces sp. 150FB]KIF74573.1 kinase [Streptomyces sp. 150FB]
MIDVPEAFARSTVAREGQRGREWIDGLPRTVDDLLERWNCAPAGPVWHGAVGVVLPVTGTDLPPAVLKVSFPHPGNVHEPDAFAAWAGRGAVTLYRRDDARFAMLLERAEPGTLADVADTEQAVTTAARLARRLAVPAPAGLPRLRDQAPGWEAALRADAAHLADPLSGRVMGAAIATFRELAPDQPDTLIHGDLHDTNILPSGREPWLAIDAKGYVGDSAYDGVTLLRTRPEEYRAAADPVSALLRRLAVFAEAAEVDIERAGRWAQARATEAALWGRRYGDPPEIVQLSDLIAETFA